MKSLDRQSLRRLIKLEVKTLMDEDALLDPPTLGEPHYMDYLDQDLDHYEEEEDYDCAPDVYTIPVMTLQEAGCGCESNMNPYEEEREEDYSLYKDHDHSDDHRHSSYMARPQLYKIAKYASKLLDMVDENEELEDWQESKIAQISSMIGSVYHSLDYDERYDHHDHDHHDDISGLIGMIRAGNI